MKNISREKVINAVAQLCQKANFYLQNDVLNALREGKEKETSEVGKNIFEQLIKNAEIAAREKMPICQDTGFTVVFVEKGDKVQIEGNLKSAINEGVRKGYKKGYLRKSIVKDPFDRENTEDNTPAVIHTDIVPGNNLKIIVVPKGGGSENMSKIKMLSPAEGKEGVKEFVINTVKKAGPNPCPPIIIGVGIGGTFEKAALIAKKALIRPIDEKSDYDQIAKFEEDLLTEINNLGIGPQGLGGRITALGVNVETFPCHIASLPVAININCHASRHEEIII